MKRVKFNFQYCLNRFFITLIGFFIISCISCTDYLSQSELDEALSEAFSYDWNMPIPFYLDSIPPDYITIGNYYQGGIIFYLDSTGQHGLVASLGDLSRNAPWWNGEFTPTGAHSQTDGVSNTLSIWESQGNDFTYAALLCVEYEYEGFNDWYLPSKAELNLLFESGLLSENTRSGLYWSSSEYELGTVWVQDFVTGEQHLNNSSDTSTIKTRAIRAF